MGRVSDTRDKLIAAAIDPVWQQGIAAVTVDSICDAAQVRKGSFYHFFSSKADLVLAALDSHWAARRPLLDRTFSPSVAPLQRLRDYFDYVYRRQTELKQRYGS